MAALSFTHALRGLVPGAALTLLLVPQLATAGGSEEEVAHSGPPRCGHPADYAPALRGWRMLAAQGDADAQNGLGYLYEKGLGVRQDSAQAYAWYTLAAAGGSEAAAANRELLLGRMSPAQVAGGRQRSRALRDRLRTQEE